MKLKAEQNNSNKYLNYINNISNNSNVNLSFSYSIKFKFNSSNNGEYVVSLFIKKRDDGLYHFSSETTVNIENDDVEKYLNDYIQDRGMLF